MEVTIDTKESDVNDFASRLTELAVEESLKQVPKPPTPVPVGVELPDSEFECRNCDEEIPKARRLAGYRICVSCAEKNERQEALYSR